MELYKGWIPTVSKRLSFQNVGNTNFPERCVSANVDIDNCRYVVCFQRRYVGDAPLPVPAPRRLKPHFEYFLNGEDTEVFFVLVAKANTDPFADNDALEGKVFGFVSKESWCGKLKYHIDCTIRGHIKIFKNNKNAKYLETPRTICRKSIHDINLLETQILRRDTNSKSAGKVATLSENTHAFLENSCDFNCAIKIEKNGVTTIQNIKKRSSDEGSNHIINIDELENLDIADQTFFFLKDIVHLHSHHESNTDNITTVTRLESPDEDNELIWRFNTMRSLFRKLTALKRDGDALKCAKAKGFIAYTKTFDSICNEFCGGVLEGRLPSRDLKNFTESVESSFQQTEVASRERQESHTIIGVYLTMIAIFIAVLTAVIAIDPNIKNSQQDSRIVSLAEIFSMHTITILCALVAVPFVVDSFKGKGILLRLAPTIITDTQRIFVNFNKFFSGAYLILSSSLFFTIGVSLLFDMPLIRLFSPTFGYFIAIFAVLAYRMKSNVSAGILTVAYLGYELSVISLYDFQYSLFFISFLLILLCAFSKKRKAVLFAALASLFFSGLYLLIDPSTNFYIDKIAKIFYF